jgi:hypothetical protein
VFTPQPSYFNQSISARVCLSGAPKSPTQGVFQFLPEIILGRKTISS